MSKRQDVLTAIKALVLAALPNVVVEGLDNGADRARRISPLGLVIIRDGDPGEPEVDMSPPVYHFQHSIPIELAARQSAEDLRAVLDDMASAIGAGIVADRFLGGLCDWVDADAMELVDLSLTGGTTQLGGQFTVTANYHTSNPLG